MDPIQKLHQVGQSLWYDNIQRSALESGELAALIRNGDIRGVTSNPTIFNNAIANSQDYDTALQPMAWAGWPSEDIFYRLAAEDIRAAADLFKPLYEKTSGGDGYVSLEVSPHLANDSQATAFEAKRLWKLVDRPNLMVKIPATPEGIPAIRQTIAAGINVNVTLIFSLSRYAAVMDAFMSGLEDRLAAGLPIGSIASVASFFVSRVDSKIDKRLVEIMSREGEHAARANDLQGKAGIANSRLAYYLYEEKFGSDRWQKLEQQGGRPQRPLWASTSTKNPAYRDVMYIEELIAPGTVNTVPPASLDLFRDHGQVRLSIQGTEAEAQQIMDGLKSVGVSMDDVTQELEDEGVKSFADSFTQLLDSIEKRRRAYQAQLGPLQQSAIDRVKNLDEIQAPKRMAVHDPSLWIDDPAGQAEIRRRMGWLEAPEVSRPLLPVLQTLVDSLKADGFTHALLLGMGGSSLAPEVMALTFENEPVDGLDLAILDSTDPGQVKAAAERSPLEKTVYIVSSKSGGTSEVMAFLDFFWAALEEKVGPQVSRHFVAITDPGTSLENLARERGFRAVFLADETVGGRNSALTAFGLVPAALIGINVERLLDRAAAMAAQCAADVPAGRNPGLVLGAIIGEGTLAGRDKLTILTDPELDAFGSWAEQLIAESSGKQGKGIVPVDLEPLAEPTEYSSDRVFVYLRQSGQLDDRVRQLIQAGHPVPVIDVTGPYDLSAEFFRWEYATAIATAILGVNSFDQPDVQDNKDRTKAKINAYQQNGSFDEGRPIWEGDKAKVYGRTFEGLKSDGDLPQVVEQFVRQAGEGDYIAINAYVPRNAETLASLQKLRARIQQLTGRATTMGFGPRFLHSTGQLHKGGPNNGVFLQITQAPQQDVEIPTQGMTFGTLERAQALGDLEALQARERRAIRVHLDKNANIEDLI